MKRICRDDACNRDEVHEAHEVIAPSCSAKGAWFSGVSASRPLLETVLRCAQQSAQPVLLAVLRACVRDEYAEVSVRQLYRAVRELCARGQLSHTRSSGRGYVVHDAALLSCPDCAGRGTVPDHDGAHECWTCLGRGRVHERALAALRKLRR